MKKNFPKDPQALFPFGWFPVLFLACFGAYLPTLNPAFPNDDSAETITAAFTLGLQHPPGYALATLGMRLSSLLPLGSISFRVNLASALLAALAVVLLTWALSIFLKTFQLNLEKYPRPLGERDRVRGATQEKSPSPRPSPLQGEGGKYILFCSMIASLLLAFSPTFWRNALGAKGGVYMLAACLSLAILGCLIRHETQPERQGPWILLAFFLTGMGLSNHWETQIILVPGLLAFYAFSLPQPLSWKALFPPALRFLAFLLLGASPLLYLPLRAHLHPVLNLGAPDSWGDFIADLSRHYVADREVSALAVFFHVLNGTSTWDQFFHLMGLIGRAQGSPIPAHLLEDMGFLALMLALLGAWAWWRSGRRKTLLFLLVSAWVLLMALLSTLFLQDGANQRWILDNFLLPLNWMAALLAGAGIFFLSSLLTAPARPTPSFLFVLVLVPCLMAARGWATVGEEKQTLAYDYGVNLLKSLPRNSLFFAEGDEDYFSLYYLQRAARLRPDVTMIPSFTLFEPWGVEQVERLDPALGLDAAEKTFADHFERIEYALGEVMDKNGGKVPCGFSYFNGAFHRYYLLGKASLVFRKSGIVLLFNSPVLGPAPLPDLDGLRFRHWNEGPSNQHPSLRGIRGVYRSAGLSG